MKTIRTIIILIAFVFNFIILIGCKQFEEKRQIIRLNNTQILFDIPLKAITKDTITEISVEELPNEIKIVSYLDQQSCTRCMFNMVRMMEDIVMHFDVPVNVYYVVYPSDIDTIQTIMNELQLNSTLLYDVNNKYLRRNNLDKIYARNRTFLLDKENRICVVGEPFANAKLRDLYDTVAKQLYAR